MGWVLFGITLLGAIVTFVMMQTTASQERARMEERQREALQKAQADSDKRFDRLEREAGRSRYSARDSLAKDLLPALDSVQLAHENLDDPEVQKGLELVLSEFRKAFARHEIETISPGEGDAFDPGEHEAVESIEAEPEDADNGTVARCHRVGYRTGDKVLRPAMVGVYRVAVAETRPAAGAEDEDEDEVVFDNAADDVVLEQVEKAPATEKVSQS